MSLLLKRDSESQAKYEACVYYMKEFAETSSFPDVLYMIVMKELPSL